MLILLLKMCSVRLRAMLSRKQVRNCVIELNEMIVTNFLKIYRKLYIFYLLKWHSYDHSTIVYERYDDTYEKYAVKNWSFESGASFDYLENALGKFDGPFFLGEFSLVSSKL
jgi:hypothetical protein